MWLYVCLCIVQIKNEFEFEVVKKIVHSMAVSLPYSSEIFKPICQPK